MKQFYQDFVTDKSYQLLLKLSREIDLILIGGWAVWIYTKNLKSQDVDILIDFKDLSLLKGQYSIRKNERLKKYETIGNQINVDIYIPYYSVLGVPVEKIMEYKSKLSGFWVIQKEVLMLMKVAAFRARAASIKGQKDKIDIISLLNLSNFDFAKYLMLLEKFKLSEQKKIILDLLAFTKEVPELELNVHRFAKLKKEILAKLTINH